MNDDNRLDDAQRRKGGKHIVSLGDAIDIGIVELMKLPNFGRRTGMELQDFLRRFGLFSSGW